MVSNVDLSLVRVDRCTYNRSRCQLRVCGTDGSFGGPYLEQDVLYQQNRVPVRNVVVAVACGDGKREHAVSQELRVAHRHEGSVQRSLPRSGRGTDGHIGYLHGYAGRGGFLSGFSPSSLSKGEHLNESCRIDPTRRSHQAQTPQTALYDNNKARGDVALQAHRHSVHQSNPSPAFNSFSRSAGAPASPASSPAANPSSLHLSHSHLKLHSRSLCCLAETGKPGST